MAQMNKQEVVDGMRALLFSDDDAIQKIRVSLVFMHMLMVWLDTDYWLSHFSASQRHIYRFYDNCHTQVDATQ